MLSLKTPLHRFLIRAPHAGGEIGGGSEVSASIGGGLAEVVEMRRGEIHIGVRRGGGRWGSLGWIVGLGEVI